MREAGDGRPERAGDVMRPDVIAETWQSLLGLDVVGEDDDFFELGGDSMLAIRMLVITVSKIGYELDYDEFFATPTLKTLRRLIAQARRQ